MTEDQAIAASTAVALIVTSLCTAHFLTPLSIEKLGKRPLGKGLWTYLYSQLFSSTAGTWGYDSSLGCFSPIWRVSFHISAILLVYSLVPFFPEDKCNCMSLFMVSSAYSAFFFVIGKVCEGVSDPGGPREHKIRRMPRWDDVNSYFTSEICDSDTKWRCAVASDSHRATLGTFGLKAEDGENGIKVGPMGMSGEPFGRQIWTRDDQGRKELDDETKALIQEMACAGRDGFNPSKNPNSADVIFREQMITNYVANGGVLPDTSSKPTNIKDAARKAVHFYSMLQTEDGHWAGDYGGPHFLMPGLIVAW